GVDGAEPSVSIGPFVSETDETEREREKHETRRLLYVALTRARDRLYLSSLLKDGVVQPGRGSLAEVLPDSIRQLLGRGASSFDEFSTIAWSGPSGRQFDWRVCRPEPDAPAIAAPAAVPELATDDFAPAADVGARAVMAVSDWLGGDGAPGGEG